MQHLLYGELVGWYPLVDPPADHKEEGDVFSAAFEREVSPAPETLLELGAGAGHTALHMKGRFRCTLVDPSAEMSTASERLNPECEHVLGDMRTVRLGREFDAVLIHDAIMYMVNETDLRAAVQTAFLHTRPGGALIIAPDCTRDTFVEGAEIEHAAEGSRAVQLMMWDWDPDPSDDSFITEYALLMRDGRNVTAAHESHVQGLFSLGRWLHILADTGYEVQMLARPLGDGTSDQVFLCQRPAAR